MEKQLVTVSRKWHEPFIRVDVTSVGIGITMSLEDFLIAMAIELSAPTEVLLTAGQQVVNGMKKETSKIV